MAKFHIKADGEPGKCSALLRPCPLGASDEEHFSSKEDARAHYEEKMSAIATTEAAKKVKEEPLVYTEEELSITRAVLADVDAMNTPENMAQWAAAEPGTYRNKLYRLIKAREDQLNGIDNPMKYSDENNFANLLVSVAAGERSGLSSKARARAKDLVLARHRDALNDEYREVIGDLYLDNSDSKFPVLPVENEDLSTTDFYEKQLSEIKEDLNFVHNLAKYWKW